ncbi:hypothetical protein Lal_00048651 [Lupinus albus]|uniref:Uncharacterized protein n=1 Tax=Lupinus albus TaxID=3870 RepID=A0A6A4P9X5_LUPAL|nr:hypothetical protein Lalb_Chr17g0347921 [Lupinus albus]KAF1864086.1 hypothetical protein Lal_00048651 [Lupinus albus]
MSRHRRQQSQVLPPEILSGDEDLPKSFDITANQKTSGTTTPTTTTTTTQPTKQTPPTTTPSPATTNKPPPSKSH